MYSNELLGSRNRLQTKFQEIQSRERSSHYIRTSKIRGDSLALPMVVVVEKLTDRLQ